jgi:hypothetical protein
MDFKSWSNLISRGVFIFIILLKVFHNLIFCVKILRRAPLLNYGSSMLVFKLYKFYNVLIHTCVPHAKGLLQMHRTQYKEKSTGMKLEAQKEPCLFGSWRCQWTWTASCDCMVGGMHRPKEIKSNLKIWTFWPLNLGV